MGVGRGGGPDGRGRRPVAGDSEPDPIPEPGPEDPHGIQEGVESLLRGEPPDVRDDEVALQRSDGAPGPEGTLRGREGIGIHTAPPDAQATESLPAELLLDGGRGDERSQAAVVEPAQVGPDDAVEGLEPVVREVLREGSVVRGDERHAESARGRPAGEAHPEGRRHVHQRGRELGEPACRGASGGEGDPQGGIGPERTAPRAVRDGVGGCIGVGHRLDVDRAAAALDRTCEPIDRARHAVDLRRERVGEDRQPQSGGGGNRIRRHGVQPRSATVTTAIVCPTRTSPG